MTAPSRAPAPSAQAEWDALVAAAKREGKVAIAGAPGSGYREAVMEFRTRYPEIQVEYQGFNARDMQVRFLGEREVGQYLWDIIINGPTNSSITFTLCFAASAKASGRAINAMAFVIASLSAGTCLFI